VANGYSLHIGVVDPNPNCVPGDLGNGATGSDSAAAQMRDQITTKTRGFLDPTNGDNLLLNASATRYAVYDRLDRITAALHDGDLFVMTLAGHGTRVVDEPGDSSEEAADDGHNQAFCLYDGLWIDDDIYRYLATITARARVIVVAQACYSGSIITEPFDLRRASPEFVRGAFRSDQLGLARWVVSPHGWRHDTVSWPHVARDPIAADVLLLAACRSYLTTGAARPDERYPLFILALLQLWEQSTGYFDLCVKISDRLSQRCLPRAVLNKSLACQAFVDEKPFTV